MKIIIELLKLSSIVLILTACSQNGDTGSQEKAKFDNKPSVIDVLKGKTKAEVLKIKYKDLRAMCNLKTEKITRGQKLNYTSELISETANPTQPISNPEVNVVVYDLKLQQEVDKDLTEEVKAELTTSVDGKSLKLEINFKPVEILETLNVRRNGKKYIMKHTPVLSYDATYELPQSDGSSVVAGAKDTIYEKIENQQNAVTAIKVGLDRYNFILDCTLSRIINDENKDLATDFESQWTVLDKP